MDQSGRRWRSASAIAGAIALLLLVNALWTTRGRPPSATAPATVPATSVTDVTPSTSPRIAASQGAPTSTAAPPAASPTAAPCKPAPRVATIPDSIALGVWTPRVPWEWDSLDEYVRQVGREPAVVMWYHDWVHGGFYAKGMDAIVARGAMPLVTWEPWDYTGGLTQPDFSLRQIASGAHDAYVRQYARDAAAWCKPFYLRFGHEMNGDWYPWGAGVNGNRPADYIAAWRHIYDIFQQEGATNVRWVWSPNYDYPGLAPLDTLYPGDDYVDWVAMDGYNQGTAVPQGGAVHADGRGWKTVDEIFTGTYKLLTALTDKPIMIAETGSAEAGGDKAAWITHGFSHDIPEHFPRVRAVLYFNQNDPAAADWRLTTSPAALDAFRRIVEDPRYRGRLP